MSLNTSGKIIAFASVVEVGTGLILTIDPAIVPRLLLGVDVSGVAAVLGRCFGIALVALGLACWPDRRAGAGLPAIRAMSAYNAAIAVYLGWLGAAGHMGGMLLWPAVALHAAVAIGLIGTRRDALSRPSIS
jgi:hypothetical protein